MSTRRSATRAAPAAASGTPIATSRISTAPSDRSPGENGSPVNGTLVSSGRSKKNTPKPTATPARAATPASTAATTDTCRGVAPTRRMAAKRCSRRAADSRVAVAMKISTGKSKARTPTARTTWSLLASQPLGPPGWATSALMLVTSLAVDESWAAVRPMTMTREFGAGRPAGPIVPMSRPGKRSPSSAGAVVRRSRARAGDA